RGESVQHVLDWRRAIVTTDEHLGVIDVVGERLLVRALLTDAEEAIHGALAVRARHPTVRRSELEFRRLGRGFHRVEGGEQRGGVDAVTDRVLGDGHCVVPFVCSGVLGLGRGHAAAVARARSAGSAAIDSASASTSALSCFWSATNSATGGN